MEAGQKVRHTHYRREEKTAGGSVPSPPGMTWPTSCTVSAEFLSSVLTRMTPWLSPPMDRMARAGRGAPGIPGLHAEW